jgi:uncharacterized membrane protein
MTTFMGLTLFVAMIPTGTGVYQGKKKHWLLFLGHRWLHLGVLIPVKLANSGITLHVSACQFLFM